MANCTEEHADFRAVERGGETIWVHKPVKRGAQVWSANNKRIGDDRGFKTLAEAFEAAAVVAVGMKEAA